MKKEKTLKQIKWKNQSKEMQTEISESIDPIGKKRTVKEKTKQNAAQREKDQTEPVNGPRTAPNGPTYMGLKLQEETAWEGGR